MFPQWQFHAAKQSTLRCRTVIRFGRKQTRKYAPTWQQFGMDVNRPASGVRFNTVELDHRQRPLALRWRKFRIDLHQLVGSQLHIGSLQIFLQA